MAQPTSIKNPELGSGIRWTAGLLGIALILSAGLLFFVPPQRVSIDHTCCGCEIRKTTDSEPTTVVVALFSGGLAVVLYSLNGLKLNKFSSPVFGAETVAGSTPESELEDPQNSAANPLDSKDLAAAPSPAGNQPDMPLPSPMAKASGGAAEADGGYKDAAERFRAFSDQSKMVIRTLWKYQRAKSTKDFSERWTFAVLPAALNYAEFIRGLAPLLERGLVTLTRDGQCVLTDEGITFIKRLRGEINGPTYQFS
jgi:hypothetical protein